MKTGLSLVDLARRITENKGLKGDFVAPASSLRFEPAETGLSLAVIDGPRMPEIKPVAHDQIGAFTGIPAKYYDRMLADDPRLLATNVNHWFAKSDERRMLRTLAGDCRAFLSDRYHRIENEDIAETALPILLETGVEIVSCNVTDRKLYISARLPKVQGEVKVGDVVQAGVTISNSEVGLGAVVVQPLIYRLVCLNGMTIPDSKLTGRHVGRRVQEGEDLNAIFADDTRKADDRAILLKVRDVIRHALSEVAFNRHLEKMKALTDGRVTGDPTKAVQVLAQKVGATEAEGSGILRALIEGGDLSAWGMLNAVTAQAHTVPDFDRSMEFVQAGGKLLNLPKSEWKEVLEAA